MKKIILAGAGGHSKVIIDAIRKSGEYAIYGIVDPAVKDKKILGVPVVGTDIDLSAIFKKGIKYAFISVGSIGDCVIRKNLYERLKYIGFQLPVIIHPASVVASNVTLGAGTFVAAGAVINPDTKVGVNVIINTSSSVDHDCHIGDFVHIAPGAVLCGGVKVGNETHIGAGATVIQNVTIGRRCIIGTGLTLRKSVKDEKNIYGIKAK